MVPRQVATVDATYWVVDDVTVQRDALVVARVIDAAARGPFANPRVHVRRPFTTARMASSGHLVIAGRVDLALPHLATANEEIEVDLHLPRRPPERLVLTVPMGSSLPLVLPDIVIEGAAIGIAGTVLDAVFPHPPTVDATVTAARTVAGAPFALALRTPLARSHPTGTTLRRRTLGALGATTVAQPVTGGATSVDLVSTAACAAGRVLAIGDPPDLEHVVIDSVAATTVVLRTPLVRTRAAGAAVAVLQLGAAGAASNLDRDLRAADGMVFTAADLTAADVVEAVDADPKLRELRATHARTDAEGRFRLQGIRGLDRVVLTPELAPAPPGAKTTVLLDPVFDPVRVDLTL